MSDVTRYRPAGYAHAMQSDKAGDWVGYRDHLTHIAKLEAANAELVGALENALQQLDDDMNYAELRADLRTALASAKQAKGE